MADPTEKKPCRPDNKPPCEKVGTGPDCSRSNNLSQTAGGGGGASKGECLSEVAQSCEEKIKKCIDKCKEDRLKKLEEFIEKELKAADDASDAEAQAQTQCESTKAFDDILDREKRVGTEVAFGDDLGGYKFPDRIAQEPPPGEPGGPPAGTDPFPDKTYGGIAPWAQTVRNNTTGQWGIHATAVANGDPIQLIKIVNGATYDNISKSRIENIKTLGKINKEKRTLCPTPKVSFFGARSETNPCFEEQKREANHDIHTCAVQCFTASIGPSCEKARCYCSLLACGGDGEGGGRNGTGGGGTTTPDTPIDPTDPYEPTRPDPVVIDDPGTGGPRYRPGKINVTGSAYGVPMELVYGRHYLFGNIAWMSAGSAINTPSLTPVFDSTGQVYTLETHLKTINTINMFVGIAAGTVDAMSRIWFGQSLAYDLTGNNATQITSGNVMVFRGSESQKVQRSQALAEGFGRAPAYRGLAGVLFNSLNIETFTSFPDIKVEILQTVDDQTDVEESSAYPTQEAERAFSVDLSARRVAFATTNGFVSLDYDTLGEVRNANSGRVVDFTSLPALVTYDAGTFALQDARYQNTLVSLTADRDVSFQLRYVDTSYGTETLVRCIGNDMYLYDVDDFYGLITPVLSYLNAFDDTPRAVLTQSVIARDNINVPYVRNSFFVFTDVDEEVVIKEYSMNSTSGTYDLGLVPEYTFTPIGLADIQIRNVFKDDKSRAFVLFIEDATNKRVVKWSPTDGVVWNKPVSYIPNYGSKQGMHQNLGTKYAWVDNVGSVQELDLATGDIVTRALNVTPADATSRAQFYDDTSGSILYVTTDDTVSRAYVGRINQGALTLGDIARDVARRAGLPAAVVDVSGVAAVEVQGYRSGANLSAQLILNDMLAAYQTTSYSVDRLAFTGKGFASATTLDADDFENPLARTRLFEAYDKTSSSIKYYSANLSGAEGIQTFALPEDVNARKSSVDVATNILENDDYMARLAELIVFSAQESDESAKVKLGPKYLGVTPSDIVVIGSKYRVQEANIGADLSTEYTLLLDSPEKYTELAEITAKQYSTTAEVVTGVGAPIAFTGKSVSSAEKSTSSVFFGVSEMLDENEPPTAISTAANEYIDAPSGTKYAKSLAWGKLITPPPPTGAPFSTQRGATMVVEFDRAEYAARLAPDLREKNFAHTMFMAPPDAYWLTLSQTENLLLVGDEWIQFAKSSVAVDGKTVTFTDLWRGRRMSDGFMAHTAGEHVMVYSADSVVERVRFPENIETYVKGSTVAAVDGLYGRARRRDAVAEDKFLTPLGCYAAMRWDMPDTPAPEIAITADIRSAAFPSVYNNGFDGGAEAHKKNYEVFLLRADYDETLFNLYRHDVFDYTYIVFRGIADSYNRTTALGGAAYWGIRFDSSDQSSAGWDYETEPLIAVHVVTDVDAREHRYITKWPVADYSRRPTRGLIG